MSKAPSRNPVECVNTHLLVGCYQRRNWQLVIGEPIALAAREPPNHEIRRPPLKLALPIETERGRRDDERTVDTGACAAAGEGP